LSSHLKRTRELLRKGATGQIDDSRGRFESSKALYNALRQPHTYFVGSMPRPYHRSLVSNTFTIDQGILEKTLEFTPGEWLLSSYIATGMENVSIFIKADNTEEEITSHIKGPR